MVELEERIARLEGRVDEHSKFFESISVKLTLLEDKGDRNRERLEEKIERTREILEEKIELYRKEFKDEIGSVRKELGEVRKEMGEVRKEMVKDLPLACRYPDNYMDNRVVSYSF